MIHDSLDITLSSITLIHKSAILDLKSILSTKRLFVYMVEITRPQYAGYAEIGHNCGNLDCFGKKHCVEAVDPLSVPKSGMNSTGQQPYVSTADTKRKIFIWQIIRTLSLQ